MARAQRRSIQASQKARGARFFETNSGCIQRRSRQQAGVGSGQGAAETGLAAKALHDLFQDFWLRAMVQRSGKNSGRRSFSFSCPATSTAGAMRPDVGELGSRADVIKIEWPPHGDDGCRGRDREFADSPLEQSGFEPLVPPASRTCAEPYEAVWAPRRASARRDGRATGLGTTAGR
jgi:hypothetical protein